MKIVQGMIGLIACKFRLFFFLNLNEGFTINYVYRPAARDSSSDGIEFVNSNGDIIESDEESEDCVEESERNSEMTPKPKALLQYMYIQMEFCEKSTLRCVFVEILITSGSTG